MTVTASSTTARHRHPPTWLLHGARPTSRWLIRRRYDVRACISHAPGSRDVLRTVAGLAGVTVVGWVPDFRDRKSVV